LKHHLYPEVCEPIFERFQNPDVAEPFRSIALLTQVPLVRIYAWQEEFHLPLDWRSAIERFAALRDKSKKRLSNITILFAASGSVFHPPSIVASSWNRKQFLPLLKGEEEC
jgi:hypothetical protein